MSINASNLTKKAIKSGKCFVFSTNLGWLDDMMLSSPALNGNNATTWGVNSQDSTESRCRNDKR